MTRVWDEEGATTPHDGAPPRRVRKHVHQGLGGSGQAWGTGGLRAQGERGGLGGSGRGRDAARSETRRRSREASSASARGTRPGPAGHVGPAEAKAEPGEGHCSDPLSFWLVPCGQDGGTGTTLVLLPEKAPTTTTPTVND